MANSARIDIIQARRNEFILRIESGLRELHINFNTFRRQLDEKEASLVDELQKIKIKTLEKFDKDITPKLAEIKQAQESIRSIISSNTNRDFMEKQVRNFDTEFDNVINKSGILNLVQLKWKIDALKIDEFCQISTNICVRAKKRRPDSEDNFFGTNMFSLSPNYCTFPKPTTVQFPDKGGTF